MVKDLHACLSPNITNNLKAIKDSEMTNKASGRFLKFIDGQEEKEDVLPLTHTTSAYSFSELCGGESIDPSVCKYFKEELIYLFYGRPAYRTEKAEFTDLEFNWPIVFIFDPKKITKIKRIYPFDTGAFHLGLYSRFFSKLSVVDNFQLPGSLSYAAKVAGTFYTNNKEYIYGRSKKNIDIPHFNFEAQGMQKLSQEPSYSSRVSEDGVTRDERSSSIEVQISTSIDIKEATLDIIIPQRYLEMPEVIEALTRWGLAKENVHYYETMAFHEQGGWLPQIYNTVVAVYKKHGFIKD